MTNVSNSSGVFTGISQLHILPGGFGAGFTLPSGKSLTEVPVAEDGGFTYNGGTPSTERYRVHGLTAPWAVRMTPGDAETNLFVPQITKAILELFGYEVDDLTITSLLSKKWSGVKFKETSKAVEVGIAALNDTEDQLFAIKKTKLLASIVFDEANSAKPIGIQLTGASTAGGDADAMGICSIDTSE